MARNTVVLTTIRWPWRRAEILAAADPFEWIHPLVLRSLDDVLTVARRDELHRRAVEALTAGGAAPSRVATHLAAQGSLASTMVAEGQRAWNAARLGDLAGAEELMRPLEDAARDNGMLLMLVTFLWYGRDLIVERSSQADMAAALERSRSRRPSSRRPAAAG